MTTLFVILIAVVSLLLMLVVLVQSPKSSGMGGAFGGSNANMLGGVKRTADFLERATWVLAIALIVLVLLVNMINPGTASAEVQESAMEEQLNETPAQAPVQTPSQAPAQPAQPADLPQSAE
ncbi:MAG: preprotein translocase subunit SecG [Cryomorphaceae bacterium]|mgnify:CR=1 FL=1|jgi:preprotein translocase subunit SecG|nr:preprotein translocase subunit SecG [Cryomorphaceae bacterium]